MSFLQKMLTRSTSMMSPEEVGQEAKQAPTPEEEHKTKEHVKLAEGYLEYVGIKEAKKPIALQFLLENMPLIYSFANKNFLYPNIIMALAGQESPGITPRSILEPLGVIRIANIIKKMIDEGLLNSDSVVRINEKIIWATPHKNNQNYTGPLNLEEISDEERLIKTGMNPEQAANETASKSIHYKLFDEPLSVPYRPPKAGFSLYS